MAREFSRARIGLFVVISVIMMISIVIWLGSQHVFTESDYYITSFAGSVSGLEVSAAVKFRGVTVGKVSDIRIDPQDSSQIEVMMEIRPGTPVKKDMVAEMRMTGITGIKYVELTGGAKETELLRPGTAIHPALIPSQATLLEKVDEQFNQLYAQLTAMIQNLERLTNEDSRNRFAETLDGISRLSQSLANTLIELQPGLGQIQEIGTETENLVISTREEIQGIGDIARKGLTDATAMMNQSALPESFSNIQQSTENLRLFTEKLNRTLDAMDLVSVSQDMRSFMKTTQETIQELDYLIKDLRRNPSSIMFSKPKPDRDVSGQPDRR